MVTLATLPRTNTKTSKRLGRGYGSGKGGHTASRGQKGQKTRDTVKLLFEGTKSNKDFFRRTPWLRGKNRLKPQVKEVVIKLSALDVFKDGDVVDVPALVKAGLLTQTDAQRSRVKVLMDKKLDKKLDLQIPASKAVLASLKG